MASNDIKMGSLTGWSYHQGGHVVAAALRGADPGVTLRLGDLLPRDVVPEAGAPFVAYAGPWAELECGAAEVEVVEGDDAFDPARISARCSDQDIVDDANNRVATLLHRAGADEDRAWGWLPGVVASWRGELREAWPVIEWAATELRERSQVGIHEVQMRLRREALRRTV